MERWLTQHLSLQLGKSDLQDCASRDGVFAKVSGSTLTSGPGQERWRLCPLKFERRRSHDS